MCLVGEYSLRTMKIYIENHHHHHLKLDCQFCIPCIGHRCCLSPISNLYTLFFLLATTRHVLKRKCRLCVVFVVSAETIYWKCTLCFYRIVFVFGTHSNKNGKKYSFVFIINIFCNFSIWINVYTVFVLMFDAFKYYARTYQFQSTPNFHWFHKSIKEKQFFFGKNFD